MSETEQERLDDLEAKLEAAILDGSHLLGLQVPGARGMQPVTRFLRERGRADLVDTVTQTRQAWLAGEVA